MSHLERDDAFMRRALALAERYRGRTAPNPIVGCVIVSASGAVLAEGAHAGPGKRHAEIAALDQLGGRAPGATMYVTLEPCTHQGRTPPCVPAVIASGVARVVIGSADPMPGHGGGLAVLRRAKISVARALVAECDAANLPFLTWAVHHRPAFTLKAAITLDGKIATRTGESRWITGEAARADGHRLRAAHDAVLVGIGTVLADDPQLTARVRGARDPVRIVLDGRLRTPPTARLLLGRTGRAARAAGSRRTAPRTAAASPRVIIATSTHAPAARERALVARGAEVWRFPTRAGARVPLALLADRLAATGLTSVLVEGGGEVHAGCFAAGLVDGLVVYIAPTIVGGSAPSWVGGAGVAALADAYHLELAGPPVQLGADLRLAARRAGPW